MELGLAESIAAAGAAVAAAIGSDCGGNHYGRKEEYGCCGDPE
jgi:hypothetical protein